MAGIKGCSNETKYIGRRKEMSKFLFQIILDEQRKMQKGIETREKRENLRNVSKMHEMCDNLLRSGKSKDEVISILQEQYPEIIAELQGQTMTLPDGTVTNRFELQLNDRIKRLNNIVTERENDDDEER